MNEIPKLDWSALEQILPLGIEFYKEKKAGNQIDIPDAIQRVGNALGIDDVGEFSKNKANDLLNEGFGQIMSEKDSQALASIFSCACVPVMKSVFDFAQGNADKASLIGNLNDVFFSNAEQITPILQNQLGIPNEIADKLAAELGIGAISIYCFAAAFKIYQKAAEDAHLAKERRIKAERLRDEAVTRLEKQRYEMESILSTYMLDRLEPFNEGIKALDQAVLDDDDDRYIAANAQLWSLFGRRAQYRNAAEFDELMLSDEAFKL